MNIETISLQHFRNFTHVQEITFPQQALLVAAAPNATGKTNFLESIVVLLRAKSFRASLEECVQWGQDHFILQGAVSYQQNQAQVNVRYFAPTKKLRLEENNAPISPVLFYSHYPLVLFLPEDTFLFTRSPAMRRNFLNTVLASSPAYLSALVQYQRVLRQRNTALKQAQKVEDVAAWTSLLGEHAATLWQHRQLLVDFLQANASATYELLFGETHEFAISLAVGAPDAEKFVQALDQAWTQEKRYAYTAYGPHRDDLICLVGGKAVEAVFSRGQLRSLVIALKVVVARFLKTLTQDEPLILFDDVLSELDEAHQQTLLAHLPATQILFTSTAVPSTIRQRSDVHFLDLRSILKPVPAEARPFGRDEVSNVPTPS